MFFMGLTNDVFSVFWCPFLGHTFRDFEREYLGDGASHDLFLFRVVVRALGGVES